MTDLVHTISESELAFIAALDYGQDVERHLTALREVVRSQGGLLREGQEWYPYEVIELGAHHLQSGHEREFAICTLLVIRAVASGFDRSTDLHEKHQYRAADYAVLPKEISHIIAAEYAVNGVKDK